MTREKEEQEFRTKVESFAEELKLWAEKDKGREELVKWLLTRTVSYRFGGTGGKFVIKRMDIENFDIVKAVRHAMAKCKPNPGDSATGWVRGGWARAYAPGWLKAYGC